MSASEVVLPALRRQGLIGDERGWSVEVVPGGLNSGVLAALDPHGRPALTLRMPRSGLGWRLRHEVVVLTQLAGAGLPCAPRRPTIVSDPSLPGGELLVHAFAPGEPDGLDLVSDRARETLGMCLAGLHAQTRRTFTIWPELATRSGTRRDLYAVRLGTLRRYTSFGGGWEYAERVERVASALRRPLPGGQGWESREFSVLHGDLSAGNILYSGDAVRLIDWEYLRNGDPAEDLAYLFAEQPLDDALWAQVAGGYLAADGDPRTLSRVERYRPLVALDAALWWADYLSERGVDPATRPEVNHRLALAELLLEPGS